MFIVYLTDQKQQLNRKKQIAIKYKARTAACGSFATVEKHQQETSYCTVCLVCPESQCTEFHEFFFLSFQSLLVRCSCLIFEAKSGELEKLQF